MQLSHCAMKPTVNNKALIQFVSSRLKIDTLKVEAVNVTEETVAAVFPRTLLRVSVCNVS